ncbi:hypothetical protein F2Q69_00033216 [Brassica cretica]|uniref:Uncharacterized protein n=1 Tax=Brassica cretica TaxID=69181 RepID=A0A8S9SF27_BRACR|nr:hypothetical protein F2Q69_00033216 [Brassica cretica]
MMVRRVGRSEKVTIIVSRISCQLPVLPAEEILHISHPRFSSHFVQIVRDIVMSKDWATIMETCWALTTAELVSAVLFLKGKDTEYTEYSAQELVDRADRSRIGRRSKEYHFCYTYSRVTSGLAHIDSVDQLSLSQSLDRLQHQPVGASLLIFMPDYLLTGKGVYRGPMTNRSSYTAVHGVSVVAVVEEDGEKVCKVRLNHGLAIGDREGYLKVSMEMFWFESQQKEVNLMESSTNQACCSGTLCVRQCYRYNCVTKEHGTALGYVPALSIKSNMTRRFCDRDGQGRRK